MNLLSKIGQLIMVGFEGPSPSDDLLEFFKDFPFGGVILFSRNYKDKGQVRNLCSTIQEWNLRYNPGAPPLFIGVDQEGGRVKRFGPPFIESPPNRTWGELNAPEKTRENARAVGKELRDSGLNINFAPVLDVDTNPDNPIIGDRSYGPDPLLVSRHGVAAIQGFMEGGVFPVGKHFPGHGHTSLDSHACLPEVDTSMKQMAKVELVPFVNGIKGGLEMLMSAHVVYKNIDPQCAATFSRRILTGLLREEMGFKGLVFSDDMEMGAVPECHDFPEACVRAVEAGCDILLICRDREKQETAFRSLQNAVKSGRIQEKRIDESLERVMRLKNRLTV
ncbi:MAG: beta-N-acetylhexosaminidase [Nitrospinae bacterium]|nr:beta-N-acetylhexosaminidase [Nitrospinota bacterium]